MLKIREAIVVEGRYDKNALSQVVDALILETGGFRVFRDEERLALLRCLAEKRGLIILTDSDGAGFLIRGFLKGAIPPHQVKHAYIPDRPGKERRKAAPGKEGKLGVEGMDPATLLEALRRAGATVEDSPLSSPAPPARHITKADFYALGLTGTPQARQRREALLARLGFPGHMSTNALLQAVDLLYSYEEFLALLSLGPIDPPSGSS